MCGAFVIPADLSHEIWPYPGNTAKFLWPIGDRINNISGFHLASHAGVFRGARFSSLRGRDEKRTPLKTPAWEARFHCVRKLKDASLREQQYTQGEILC